MNVELFHKHPAWGAVLYVCRELHSRGHLAYLAGGSVRDALLGRRPKDFDIATSASPQEVEQIFAKTVAVGKAFGVIIVVVEKEATANSEAQSVAIEVTTFRSDGDYSDGRRPSSIQFSNPEKDSERRDFTINALFFDIKIEKVIDYQNGLKDLEMHLIRAVGEPAKRFTEDKLRMLRAVRFAGQLGFKIEDQTLSALRSLHKEINVVSLERITDEVGKIWQSQDPLYSFMLMQRTSLTDFIFRGFSFLKNVEATDLFMKGLELLAGDENLGWRWLAYCEAKSAIQDKSEWASRAGDILNLFRNFNLSRDLTSSLDFCLRNLADFEKRDTNALILLDHKNGTALLQLVSLERKIAGDIKFYEEFVERYREQSGPDGFLQAPYLNGRDIESLGVPKGPKIGELLASAYKAQLDGHIHDRQSALEWIEKAISR